MAVATWSSSAALMKALVLPLIVALLAVAAGASNTEDGPALANSGGTQVGRKLLNVDLCGPGVAPDFSCKSYLFLAKNATCCADALGSKACWDVGAFWLDKCGSCTNKCRIGETCCYGVCADLLTDNNNCGVCTNKCPGLTKCKLGLCGY